MKNILLVDTWNKGHHLSYAKGHIKAWHGHNIHIVYPEQLETEATVHVFPIKQQYISFSEYCGLIKMLLDLIDIIKPDIVHFLTGDYLLRFFGYRLQRIKEKTRVFITFHQYKNTFIKALSVRRILANVDGVFVHSLIVKDKFSYLKSNKVHFLTYPCLCCASTKGQKEIRQALNMALESKWIGFFGATRYDKGLDILLKAMKFVNPNIHLLIAGKPTDTGKSVIDSYSKSNPNIKAILRYLTDEEMSDFVNAVDVMVLPYRRGFSGASGPLTLGIAHNKFIIGPNEGSLSQIILDNDLGLLFEPENSCSLAKVIEEIFAGKMIKSENYNKYRTEIDLKTYCKKYLDFMEM